MAAKAPWNDVPVVFISFSESIESVHGTEENVKGDVRLCSKVGLRSLPSAIGRYLNMNVKGRDQHISLLLEFEAQTCVTET